MPMFHLYILYSPSKQKYYIGHTGDELKERLRKHNTNHKGFTGGIGDWQIVYRESYSTKSEALAREMQIKKWKSVTRIRALIGSEHPD